MHLVVMFRHESRPPYTHAVNSEIEAQDTINGWTRAGGLWVINGEARRRVWVPWHSVNEVSLPLMANTPMVVHHPSNPLSQAKPRPPFLPNPKRNTDKAA